MTVIVKIAFRDKRSGEWYREGKELEISENRYKEIASKVTVKKADRPKKPNR